MGRFIGLRQLRLDSQPGADHSQEAPARRMLVNEDNTLTSRGQKIINGTPAGRFGEPDELVSTLIWLCGAGSRFITGIVVPVDGGFSAFTGV